MDDLLKNFEGVIAQRNLLRVGEAVLVAVSGGLDSMVLLDLLAGISRAKKWRLVVAHFNHGLRGRSSDADERLVRRRAAELKLRFVGGRGDVKKFAREHGLSLEMAGRKLRHGFLAKVAVKRRIKVIALAHHANDQVELFFLRLLRGAGSEGLAGMKWRGKSPANGKIELVRPLLGERKGALHEYAKARRIEYREDATNAQLDVQRNRIRRELIPLLTRKYQPALVRVVLRAMEVLGAEGEVARSAAEAWRQQVGKGRGRFDELPVAVQRHCVEGELRRLGVMVSYGLVEELRERAGRVVVVSEGLGLRRDDGGRVSAVETGGKVVLGGGKGAKRVQLRGDKGHFRWGKTRVWWGVERGDNGTFRAGMGGVNCEYFDAKKVGTEIFLRHWRAGDRFQPLGMEFGVKLQDLFVNQKVRRAERHERMVATTSQGEIFWVEGMRMAERFKLDRTTTHWLKWKWQRV